MHVNTLLSCTFCMLKSFSYAPWNTVFTAPHNYNNPFFFFSLFPLLQLPMEEKDEGRNQILREYRAKAEYYVCACLNKNNSTNVQRTPGGLLYIRQWNNMQYVSTAAFLLMTYSDHLRATDQLLNCNGDHQVSADEIFLFAKSQVDYILGNNPMNMSYLVGYGDSYPQRVHHRAASIDSYRISNGFIGCTQGYDNWYSRQDSNPNVLVGALIGGPDVNDQFKDSRGNYVQTEACTYNTAPLVGVFAKLHYSSKGSHINDHLALVSSS